MGLAVAALATCALPLFLTASFALAIQDDLDLATTDIGVAIAAFWVVGTLGVVVGGRLVDRIGSARSVRLAGATVGLANLGIAVLAHSFEVFVVLLAVTALGNALIAPAMSVLVKEALRPGVRGTTFGLQLSGPPLAGILAGITLSAVGDAVDWRWVFVAAGALAVAATAVVRKPEAEAGEAGSSTEAAERGAAGPALEGEAPGPAAERGASGPLLLVGGSVGSGVANGFIAYLVVFAVGSGLSTSAAGWLLTAAGLACVVTRIAVGVLADYRPWPRLPQMAVLLAVSAFGFALLALDAPWATVVGSLLALGLGWGWGGLYVLTAVEASHDAPGRTVGAAISATFAGPIVGPAAVGLGADATSFAIVWLACGALCLVAAAAFLGARRPEATA